jgi:DNA-binding MarR family transcriptional regulator
MDEVAEALYQISVGYLRRRSRDISLTGAATLGTLERTGPRRITELAMSEGVTQPSMTALVIALERHGLVSRQPDLADQRAVLVGLTPAGVAYLRDRRTAGAAAIGQLIDRLPAEDLAVLAAAGPALRRLSELQAPQVVLSTSGSSERKDTFRSGNSG